MEHSSSGCALAAAVGADSVFAPVPSVLAEANVEEVDPGWGLGVGRNTESMSSGDLTNTSASSFSATVSFGALFVFLLFRLARMLITSDDSDFADLLDHGDGGGASAVEL